MKKGDKVKHHSGRLAMLACTPRLSGFSFVVVFDGTHCKQTRARSEFSLPDGTPIPDPLPAQTASNGTPAPKIEELKGSAVSLDQLEQAVAECWTATQKLDDAVARLRVRAMIREEFQALAAGEPADLSTLSIEVKRVAQRVDKAFAAAGVMLQEKARA